MGKRVVSVGNREIEMMSNGLTPVLYKRVFHKDFLLETQKKDIDLTVFQELAYVMTAQAQGTDIKKLMTGLSEESYYEWLEGFEPMDLMEAVNDIFAVYHDQTKSMSHSKKNP